MSRVAGLPAPRPTAPEWTRTIRFRLTVTYSALLFGLAALVLAGLYAAVSRRVAAEPVTGTVLLQQGVQTPRGFVPLGEGIEVADVRTIEQAAYALTLEALRTYSLALLAALFLASLVLGWWLSGRALRPVDEITRTAAEISATDLSRRISLEGPDDELRRLAATLDAMLDRLDEAFAAQRRLVDDASHELRTPLAVIRANVDAVLTDPGATPEQRDRAADVVVRATDRMAHLVDDLLATARRAGPAFVEAEVDLAEVCREALEEAALVAPEAVLRSGLADGVRVCGDRDALRRAVGNLLSNAVRLSPPGREVLCACGSAQGWAWVAVRDRGPGLPAEARDRVFDRFYRVEGRSASGGAGLGLAIVRQIVESHGGDVAVHSRYGEGATFVLWLPAGDGAAGRGATRPPLGLDPLTR